ncbi:MAG: hypothetical protein HRU09_17990 [Oligoflexales bacterium]|nr:hypothetical protein [Oligoflexales bacterium]
MKNFILSLAFSIALAKVSFASTDDYFVGDISEELEEPSESYLDRSFHQKMSFRL